MIEFCPNCGNCVQSEDQVCREVVKGDQLFCLRRCSSCSITYTFFEKEINLSELYDRGDYKIRDTTGTVFHKIQNVEYRRPIKFLICQGVTSVLDFGCGKGVFLALARSYGLNVCGVETSKPRAEYAMSRYALAISNSNYEDGMVFNSKVDAITLFHVLEHLQYSRRLLSNLIANNLKSAGLVIIEVPNFESLQSRIAKEWWLHLDVPRHLAHFDINSIKILLRDLNLTPLKYEWFSLHLGVPGMLQAIMTLFFGYKRSLINDLKAKPRMSLLVMVLLALPFAFIAEALASFVSQGGVIRVYARYGTE